MNAMLVGALRLVRPLDVGRTVPENPDADHAPASGRWPGRAAGRPETAERARRHGRSDQARPARWPRGFGRRLGFGLILLLAISLPLAPPGRLVLKTLLILPELFPEAPARPLLWVSAPPRQEEYPYRSLAGSVESDLYLPAGDGPHGAVIVYTGVFGVRRAPALVRFGETLARSGAVVMIPESSTLQAGDISPAEVDTLLQALAYLRQRPEVDPRRIGIFGASVGGSLALLAATDEAAGDQLAFVHLTGSYYDAAQLLREVAGRQIEVEGQRVAWEPDQITRYTLARQVIGPLPDGPDREILWRTVLDQQPLAPGELERLSPEGRLMLELCTLPAPERVDEILAGLPASSRERLAAISPSRRIAGLKTRLYLLHDRSDSFIPFTQSRRLAAEAPPGTVQLTTESDLFKHVTPNTEAHPAVFARSLPPFLRHAWTVGGEFL
jgi:acetyl esterase/lipase